MDDAPRNVITRLAYQKKDKERVNVYLDGEYAFAVTELVAAGLHRGQQLGDAEIEALKDEDTRNKAYNLAIRYLGYRPRSRYEVEQHLRKKEYAPDVIAEVIAKLETRTYLDDRAFAAYWVENRSQFRQKGVRALRYELRQKGIDSAIIEETTNEMNEEELAWEAIQPKLRSWNRLEHPAFEKKVMGYLSRRGFGYAVARQTSDRAWEKLGGDDHIVNWFDA